MLADHSTQIRSAAVGDVDAIAETHLAAALAAYAHIFPADDPKPTLASLRTHWTMLVGEPATNVLVAAAPDVVGCVAIRPNLDVPSGLLLRHLYVHPDVWGRGVGRALHRAALDATGRRGKTSLNLWVLAANHRARGMYERWGWELVPGRTLLNEPSGVPEVLYQRAVT